MSRETRLTRLERLASGGDLTEIHVMEDGCEARQFVGATVNGKTQQRGTDEPIAAFHHRVREQARAAGANFLVWDHAP